jgi:hypothetical protein
MSFRDGFLFRALLEFCAEFSNTAGEEAGAAGTLMEEATAALTVE